MSVYVTIGAIDPTRSYAFWNSTLAAIGWGQHQDFPGWRAYSKGGTGEDFVLWVCKPFDGEPASAGNGQMVGFIVTSPKEVDAFYEAAIAHGGTDEGTPGPRPQYGPSWYAAYMRDPAGNKVSVVYNG